MQETANFPAYLWQINGKPVSVLVNADIVDRLAAVVMRATALIHGVA